MTLSLTFYHERGRATMGVKQEPSTSNEELVAEIQRGSGKKLPQLWEQVERFAAKLANRWARALTGVEFEDLYQSGYLAMVKAVETYDATQDMKFIGWYAFHLKSAFLEAGGRRSKRQQLDPIHSATSLDLPLGEDSDGTLADLVAAPDAYQETEDRIWREELHAAMKTALGALPADERDTLRRRFWQGQTLAAIGQETGATTEQVRQREGKALRALRHPRICKPLREFIEEQTPYYLRVGVERFNTTGTSAVEEIVFRRERIEQCL